VKKSLISCAYYIYLVLVDLELVLCRPTFSCCCACKDHDEDITCSDTTILANFDSKVKQFFVMIVCDSFDELMLHHDVCSLTLSKIHTWTKKSIKHTWKA
jgi:hypothetical protein